MLFEGDKNILLFFLVISVLIKYNIGKFKSWKCKNKDFCNEIMPSKDNKILEFNQYQKSDKAIFIIYADLECIIEKIDKCKNK